MRIGTSACSDEASAFCARTTASATNSGPPVHRRCKRSAIAVPNRLPVRSRLVHRARRQLQFDGFPAAMRRGRRRPHDSLTGSGTVRNGKRGESPSRVRIRLIPIRRIRTAGWKSRITLPRRVWPVRDGLLEHGPTALRGCQQLESGRGWQTRIEAVGGLAVPRGPKRTRHLATLFTIVGRDIAGCDGRRGRL